MSGFMNPAEFANIAKSEERFWWYRGMRSILFRMLDPFLAGRRVGRALDRLFDADVPSLVLDIAALLTQTSDEPTILEIGGKNPDLVVLDADLSKSTMTQAFGPEARTKSWA